MADAVSQTLRRFVAERADACCEYCLMPERLLLAGCEVDHIISRKHGGASDASNLAFSCARCNRAKGTDVGSLSPTSGTFVRLFNPRGDIWREHFSIDGARIGALTEIAEVTLRVLRLNDQERLLERSILQKLGEYPQ